MIPEMLTAKESYHYFQSVKHALEISEDRMHQIQMQLYREMMKIVETEC